MAASPETIVAHKTGILYMALELGSANWKIAFSDHIGRNPRVKTINVHCDFSVMKLELLDEIKRAKTAFLLPQDAPVASCYEAGRDGFWIHRCLIQMQVDSHVVEPSSILVNRKQRRAKTDRLDAIAIVTHLIRYLTGDKLACRMIRIPDAPAEDIRNLDRELHALKTEKTSHTNRIKGLLIAQGIRGVEISPSFKEHISQMQTPDGRALGAELTTRLLREFERVALVVDQIREIEKLQAIRLRLANKAEVEATPEEEAKLTQPVDAHQLKLAKESAIALQLCSLQGIGTVTAWTLATEIFGWRDIKNRRQLGALAGLVPMPFASGQSEREQGISKSGRAELRSLMIEIAWMWLLYQPNSALSQWYRSRFDDGTKRNRKRGIVALARKLLVALGKYVSDGELPEGATLARTNCKEHYTTSLRVKPKPKNSKDVKKEVKSVA